MSRKIIKLSPTTHVVSIPVTFMRNNNLKKGDELTVTEHKNGLLIEANPFVQEKKTELNFRRKHDDEKFALLDAAYIAGFNEIVIFSDNPEYIHKMIRYFPGFVITEEKSGTLTARDISDPKAATSEQLTLRVYHMITDMIKDGIKAYENEDWKVLDRIKYRDYVINSYASYAIRQLLREPKHVTERSLIHVLIKQTEEFSDTAALILKDASGKKNMKELLKQLLIVCESARGQWQKKKHSEELFKLGRLSKLHPAIANHAFNLYETGLQLGMLADKKD